MKQTPVVSQSVCKVSFEMELYIILTQELAGSSIGINFSTESTQIHSHLAAIAAMAKKLSQEFNSISLGYSLKVEVDAGGKLHCVRTRYVSTPL